MGKELQVADNARSRMVSSYSSNEQEFVTMRVDGQLFGISVMAVRDVLRKQKIASVPLTPPVIAGSLNLRGRIVTAIDMRVRLDHAAIEDYTTMFNVVVEYKTELYSLLVDSVGDVMRLPLNKFEKLPVNMEASWSEISAGVFKLDKELLIILDVERVIDIFSQAA